jgi:diacylglycerol kinase family enzyme
MTRPLVVIQRNPTSGSGRGRIELLRLWHSLKDLGFRVRMFSNRSRLDSWLRGLPADRVLRCIVAAGGDGTAADVLNRHPGIPVALLPLGTENLLARYCGLSRDGRQLAQVIARNRVVIFDSAEVNARRFLLMASAGPDAAVVQTLHQARSGTITRVRYIRPTLQAIVCRPLLRYRVTADTLSTPVEGLHVLVTNIPRYGFGLAFSPEAQADDGQLDVRIYHGTSRWQMLLHVLCLKLGLRVQEPLVQRFTATEIRIEAIQPRPLVQTPAEICQCDGDPGPSFPLQIRVQPASIHLMVPADWKPH